MSLYLVGKNAARGLLLMATEFCPCCHRPMPHSTRHGVALTVNRAQIFDLVSRDPGLSAKELGGALGRSDHNIRVHIQQINRAFDGTGISIEGASGWGYRVRRKQ